MAATLTLVKGQTLRKLILLLLLTFAGLGGPPHSCEAVKCLNCNGTVLHGKEDCTDFSRNVDCPNGCFYGTIIRPDIDGGKLEKGCHDQDGYGSFSEKDFRCIQKHLPESSKDCMKGTWEQFSGKGGAFEKCASENLGQGKQNFLRARDGGTFDPNDIFDYCTCYTDFCSGRDGGNGGNVVAPGGNLFQVGVITWLTIRLVTNFIFY